MRCRRKRASVGGRRLAPEHDNRMSRAQEASTFNCHASRVHARANTNVAPASQSIKMWLDVWRIDPRAPL